MKIEVDPTMVDFILPRDRATVARATSAIEAATSLPDAWSGVLAGIDMALPGRGSIMYDWAAPGRVGRVAHTVYPRGGWAPLTSARDAIEAAAMTVSRRRDPRLGRPSTVHDVFGGDAAREREYRALAFRPHDVGEQLRVTFYEGQRLLALVAALRGPRDRKYSEREIGVMRVLAPTIKNALRASRALGDALPHRSTLAQVLDAFPHPALLVDSQGRVLLKNVATRWTNEWPSELGSPTRIPPAHAQVTRIDIDGRSAWLVLPNDRSLPATPRPLSPALREIAEGVVEGLTDKEIAARTGRPVRTVRTYVERIYRALAVHSRIGLVRALTTKS